MGLRRLIAIVGTATAASGLALSVVPMAGAKSGVPKGATVVKCKDSVTTQIPAGTDQELPSAPQGTQWGSSSCKKLGNGIEKTTYTLGQFSGNFIGKFKVYLNAGTVTGKFKLLPQEGSLGNVYSPTFGFASYAGNAKVVSGTGAWTGIKGKGTDLCMSKDGLHYTCFLKLILTKL
jgi:hypothetical protein